MLNILPNNTHFQNSKKSQSNHKKIIIDSFLPRPKMKLFRQVLAIWAGFKHLQYCLSKGVNNTSHLTTKIFLQLLVKYCQRVLHNRMQTYIKNYHKVSTQNTKINFNRKQANQQKKTQFYYGFLIWFLRIELRLTFQSKTFPWFFKAH